MLKKMICVCLLLCCFMLSTACAQDTWQAYAAEGQTAFAELLSDYLTGAFYDRFNRDVLDVREAEVVAGDNGWQLVFTGYYEYDDVFFRFSVDEEYIRVLAGKTVSLHTGDTESQLWPGAQTLSAYYAGFEGILKSYMTWEYKGGEAAEENAEPFTLAELKGQKVKFPKNKSYDVYQGPGAAYGRAANGKGKVSTNGDIYCYGTWKGYLLIEYNISKTKDRFGWIALSDLPANMQSSFEKLAFSKSSIEYMCGVTKKKCTLTDDPFRSGAMVTVFEAGTSVHVLAKMGDFLLVEGFNGRLLRMGFVPANAIDLEHGYTQDAQLVIDKAQTFSRADIESAAEALKAHINAWWAGMGLQKVKYVEADNADKTAWWQPDSEGAENIRLYADLSSMELFDFEIAAYGVAREYIFILSRYIGGEWQVINWGYE